MRIQRCVQTNELFFRSVCGKFNSLSSVVNDHITVLVTRSSRRVFFVRKFASGQGRQTAQETVKERRGLAGQKP